MRNILSDCPLVNPRYWALESLSATPTQFGFSFVDAFTLNGEIMSFVLAGVQTGAMFQPGDQVYFVDGDYDLMGSATSNTFTILSVVGTGGGATLTVRKPTSKSTITTEPSYMVALLPFRNLTMYPLKARGSVNAGAVYVGPSSIAGNNWVPVETSYTSGFQWNAVIGGQMNLGQLYAEAATSGDSLYLLFH
jgi:hypothetical protein